MAKPSSVLGAGFDTTLVTDTEPVLFFINLQRSSRPYFPLEQSFRRFIERGTPGHRHELFRERQPRRRCRVWHRDAEPQCAGSAGRVPVHFADEWSLRSAAPAVAQ